jgi:NodT family efflux transporter outer membrane factor (OMF) lipoprotein
VRQPIEEYGNGDSFLEPDSRMKSIYSHFHRTGVGLLIGAALLLGGCTVGPKYARPSAATAPAYKELTPADYPNTDGWKVATPADDALRGKWWEIFHDPQLNALEDQVNISNQNIAAAAANFLVARALVKQARSQYYPTVGVNPSITNQRPSSGEFGGITTSSSSSSSSSSTSGFSITSFTDYSLPFDASWEPDLWGRARNNVRANIANAQATAADAQNVRLSAQAEVAVDYFEIRAQDAFKQLFDSTVSAYQDSVDVTRIQFQAGIASEEVVAQAETQLESTQAEDTNLDILRAQYEHAIAMLTGQPASTFSLSVEPIKANPPAVPLGLPSLLLERRPDVAAGERRVEQANAQIGVAEAAYYPNITLSASAGFGSTSIADWFAWPNRFWSVGPALAETIFDGGLRRGAVQQYQAAYDQAVANYRETVLTAFQQVEDNLAAVRVLSKEIRQQDTAVVSAQRNLEIAQERYRAGIDPYLNVITAQTTLLTNQQTAVNLRVQQMTSSVQLIKALGGGWDASDLPTTQQISSKTPAPSAATP